MCEYFVRFVLAQILARFRARSDGRRRGLHHSIRGAATPKEQLFLFFASPSSSRREKIVYETAERRRGPHTAAARRRAASSGLGGRIIVIVVVIAPVRRSKLRPISTDRLCSATSGWEMLEMTSAALFSASRNQQRLLMPPFRDAVSATATNSERKIRAESVNGLSTGRQQRQPREGRDGGEE